MQANSFTAIFIKKKLTRQLLRKGFTVRTFSPEKYPFGDIAVSITDPTDLGFHDLRKKPPDVIKPLLQPFRKILIL